MEYKKGQVQHGRHINDIYNKDTKAVAERKIVGKLYYMLGQKALLTVRVRSKHSFLYSFSYLTIKKYPISQLFSRMNNYTTFFFEKLLIDFDKYNLHYKYKYRNKIDKTTLRDDLMNNLINQRVIQFIADYMDMHIIVNDLDSTTEYGDLVYYLSRNTFDCYKPVIMMYKNNDRYYPLFFDKHYILNSSDQFKWKLYIHHIRESIASFRFPSKLNVKLYSMKLKDLQELAAKYDISIHKLSKNGKKITNKTKTELKTEFGLKLKLTL
jgi:hypothetical protein